MMGKSIVRSHREGGPAPSSGLLQPWSIQSAGCTVSLRRRGLGFAKLCRDVGVDDSWGKRRPGSEMNSRSSSSRWTANCDTFG